MAGDVPRMGAGLIGECCANCCYARMRRGGLYCKRYGRHADAFSRCDSWEKR